MCTHKRQTICFCLSCLIANPFFKPDSFPVDMNFFTIKSPLDEINKITFTVGSHIHCYPIMLMGGGFWRRRELICTKFIRRRCSGSWKNCYVMIRDCVVSSTSNTGKTIFKEKNGATSWIVILVYLLVSPFHETHCSWRDEFLIWISLYFPEEFSLNSWTAFGGHGCGRSKKHF